MSTLPHIIQSRFNRALTVVHSLPQDEVGLQPIPTDRLKFYGLYKQATLGECNTPKPSSRKVVDYAKWKAWYRVRQLDRMEAQNLYVNALVELLVEFIHRYPNNQYIEFAKEALQSLETDLSDEESYAWESSLESPNLLTFIEPQDLTNYTHLVTSPTTSYFTNGTIISQSPSLFTSTIATSVTQQDIKTPPIHYYQKPTMNAPSKLTSPPASPTLSVPPSHISERTLEDLQTQVTALTEQMDRVRKELQPSKRWLSRIILTLIKHLLANTLMAALLFGILWYRRSPLAIALANYLSSQSRIVLHSLIRSTVRKVMFWKLTV